MADSKKPSFKYAPGGKFCPKCGARMAAHEDRYSCGRCAYTEWKTAAKGQGNAKDKGA